ncbi:MAG: hypothetical protein JNK38_09465 [Acidobacteria bacterium]|nr:hypothetical protein [Acidobacteriota bacterium]
MNNIELKACKFSYYVFGTICGLPLALSLIVSWRSGSIFPGVFISFLALISFYVWLGFFKLGLLHGEVFYRSLWQGTRSISINDISKTVIEVGYDTYSDRSKPFARLVIYPNDLASLLPIYVNLKVFDKHELELFLASLKECHIPVLRKRD